VNIVSPIARAATVASTGRPTREEAEAAVRTLLRWAGDDPTREGLLETPARVARAYKEFFAGYEIDPDGISRVHSVNVRGFASLPTAVTPC